MGWYVFEISISFGEFPHKDTCHLIFIHEHKSFPVAQWVMALIRPIDSSQRDSQCDTYNCILPRHTEDIKNGTLWLPCPQLPQYDSVERGMPDSASFSTFKFFILHNITCLWTLNSMQAQPAYAQVVCRPVII